MSNPWSYDIVLRDGSCLSKETITEVVQTLNRMDYSVWDPEFKKITGISADGLHALEFDDWEVARTHLCMHGGLITTWKALGESDYNDLELAFNLDRGTVSLSVDYDLSRAREDDVLAAEDLGLLFAALCDRLDPVYGYSTDEYRFEGAFPDVAQLLQAIDDLHKAARTLTPPLALFWLNYYSQAYFEQITERLSDLPFQKKRTGKGVHILLSEHPWGARVAVLGPDGKYRLV